MFETQQILPLRKKNSWLARILVSLSIIVVVIYGFAKNTEVIVNIYLSVLGIVLTPVLRCFCIFIEELYSTWTWTRINVLNSFKQSFSGTVWKPIVAVILIGGIALWNRSSFEPELDVISILSGISVGPLVAYLLGLNGADAAMYKLKTFSTILNGEIELILQLQQWLGEKCKWNLCYKASRDGWKAKDFHKHCDNKGPTVVLVKANDCIRFGGYTDQHWDSSGYGASKRSNSSFLFSLRNNDKLVPFIANMKQGQEQNATFCYSGCGPSFGAAIGRSFDLYICGNPLVYNDSFSNFGNTYQLPQGYVYGSEQAKNLLAGQTFFRTTEIEVFN